jgi:hypothetical protein
MHLALTMEGWNWAFGGGLAFVFLWLISVPVAREHSVHETAVE